jgi:C1A family cysteine protease
MKVLKKVGICSEADYPYIDRRFKDNPSLAAESHAGQYKISEYHRVQDSFALKAALSEGQPVVIGLQVYESFQSDEVARSGIVPFPKKMAERILGGHAMLAVGYVDRGKSGAVIVRNSWGNEWGDQGYCYMPYKMFQDSDCIMDMWTGSTEAQRIAIG